ncbi:MAG: dephospho-CoA kinase [bacterium]|nr:dephospho-CoA kinase [bacterium]
MKAVYGLTGNMGCGKSTALSFFKEIEDIVTVEMDKLAHEVMESPEITRKLRQVFGPRVTVNGKLDRRTLGKIVFKNKRLLRQMESIVHPLVWEKTEELITRKEHGIFIIESAIIFETQSQGRFDKIICVTCDEEKQKNRLRKRGYTDEKIINRLNNQFDIGYKERHSNYIIRTDGSLAEMRESVMELYNKIKEENDEYHSSIPGDI